MASVLWRVWACIDEHQDKGVHKCKRGRHRLPRTWYHASTAITNEAALASRYDSPFGRKATERVLTDTLYSTKFLPPIGRGGSKRLYDLVDNVCPEVEDIVREAGREVGLDLGVGIGIGMSASVKFRF